MNQRLIIGNKIIKLAEVDSTNRYLKDLIVNTNQSEGLVVFTKNQTEGVGQRGNLWYSERNKNITFSLLLKPKIDVQNQFELTQIISLAIIDFLIAKGVKASIKWPNDIFIDDNKVGGMLIENTVRDKKIIDSVVGIGLNINQTEFSKELTNVTSLKVTTGLNYELYDFLEELLNFIDKEYLTFKTNPNKIFKRKYLDNLFRFNKLSLFEIREKIIEAKIVGVDDLGMMILNINGDNHSFDLKEVKFII